MEKYIGECLTSLANQTFQDFDVIVVDDCSTDNSRKIVQGFLETFSGRLKLKKMSKNSGYPGLPRNTALDMARGKYVYFLDSDDLLTETALEELYNVAEKFDADVVHVEKCFIFNENEVSEALSIQKGEFVTEPTLETFDIGERVEGFTQKRYLWWACNKLFRRKFLRDNKITFPAIKSWEDFVFLFECLVTAKNYVRVPFVSYYYRIRNDSLSHEAIDVVIFMDNIISVIKSTDDFMSSKKFFIDNPQYKYMLVDFFMQERLDIFTRDFILKGDYTIGEVYNLLCKKIFSPKSQDTVALTAYLFVATNLLKLYAKNLEVEN